MITKYHFSIIRTILETKYHSKSLSKYNSMLSLSRMKRFWWILFILPMIPTFAKNSTGKSLYKLLTCSWHQKNETTSSQIHEFKPFSIKVIPVLTQPCADSYNSIESAQPIAQHWKDFILNPIPTSWGLNTEIIWNRRKKTSSTTLDSWIHGFVLLMSQTFYSL